MPEILTYQYAEPAQFGIERGHLMTFAEVSPLFEHSIGRRIDFAMYVPDQPIFKKHRRVVESMIIGALNEADDDRDRMAGLPQRFKPLVTERVQTYIPGEISQCVPGQTQLGKNHHLCPL